MDKTHCESTNNKNACFAAPDDLSELHEVLPLTPTPTGSLYNLCSLFNCIM